MHRIVTIVIPDNAQSFGQLQNTLPKLGARILCEGVCELVQAYAPPPLADELPGLTKQDVATLRRVGLHHRSDLQSRTMIEVWQATRYWQESGCAGVLFRNICRYMDGLGLKFADGYSPTDRWTLDRLFSKETQTKLHLHQIDDIALLERLPLDVIASLQSLGKSSKGFKEIKAVLETRNKVSDSTAS